MEIDKRLLARALHDELGGKLISALMDLGWLEHKLGALPEDMLARFQRSKASLLSAVDFKRKWVEELHPTLLDNVGLTGALRHHLQVHCTAAGVTHEVKATELAASLNEEEALALFRIMEEVLQLLLLDHAATWVRVTVSYGDGLWSLELASDAGLKLDSTSRLTLARARRRARAMGGDAQLATPAAGATTFTTRFPARAGAPKTSG